jgi:hypothetical protein
MHRHPGRRSSPQVQTDKPATGAAPAQPEAPGPAPEPASALGTRWRIVLWVWLAAFVFLLGFELVLFLWGLLRRVF